MSRIISIAQLGNPILRQRAGEITVYGSPIQNLIDEMMATYEDAYCTGLAAPQVRVPLRVFILSSSGPSPLYPDAPVIPAKAILNPEIVSSSDENVSNWEGCLSIPGLRGLVPRAKSLYVKYQDRQGVEHSEPLEGFPARVFQHELDHLNGILITDSGRATELMMEVEYQRMLRGRSK